MLLPSWAVWYFLGPVKYSADFPVHTGLSTQAGCALGSLRTSTSCRTPSCTETRVCIQTVPDGETAVSLTKYLPHSPRIILKESPYLGTAAQETGNSRRRLPGALGRHTFPLTPGGITNASEARLLPVRGLPVCLPLI